MKIIFLLSTASNPNNIKRIEEFLSHGYEVEVYSFFREYDTKTPSDKFEVHSMGVIPSDLSYYKRLGLIYRGLMRAIHDTSNEKCIYYIIRNDLALVFSAICHRPYIFEEADMTHVNLKSRVVRNLFEKRIKRIIENSTISVFRSEGFLQYHFGSNPPSNTFIISNRLHPDIIKYSPPKHRELNVNHLRFGFVGAIRFASVLNFAKVILQNYPQHEVHFFGIFSTQQDKDKFSSLETYPNYHYHGPFKSPVDLSNIYEKIDLVISTYDIDSNNCRYAEPNKLYESIYFETPIIVSSDTFLASKVERLGVGYSINAMDEEMIMKFIEALSCEDIMKKQAAAGAIEKNCLISKNEDFFNFFDSLNFEND